MQPFINHVTLLTGHNRPSPRSEVHKETIEMLHPWIVANCNSGQPHSLPVDGLAIYGAQLLSEQGFLFVTLYGPKVDIGERVPILSFGVAQRPGHAKELWELMVEYGSADSIKKGLKMPNPPYCAVLLYPGLEILKGVLPGRGLLKTRT